MQWAGKRVSVVGLGKSNRALATYLVEQGAFVVARDVKDRQALGDTFLELAQLGVDFKLGKHYLDDLYRSECIFLTPGMPKDLPEIRLARRRGIPISSETNLFFDLCRAPIIGITGSSGKTTTTSLIGAILEAAGHDVYVGGNIGRPLIDIVNDIPSTAWVVLELSSFQLELLRRSPSVALVTNISPNHLDLHGTMDAYVDAKRTIYAHQKEDDVVILNYDDVFTRDMAMQSEARVIWFSMSSEPPEGAGIHNSRIAVGSWQQDGERTLTDICSVDDIRLIGAHNLANVLAATAVGHVVGVSAGTMADVITSFTGVAHRLELVREAAGIRFYNDSIATSPTRSIAGIKSFDRPIWLLAGGYDKGLPFDDLGEAIVRHVRGLFVFGDTAQKIVDATKSASHLLHLEAPFIHFSESLEDAVRESMRRASNGDVVLLSPGAASYDMFTNFEARGEAFRKIVHKLTEHGSETSPIRKS